MKFAFFPPSIPSLKQREISSEVGLVLAGWPWAIDLTSLCLSSNVKREAGGRGEEGITIVYINWSQD